MELESLCLLMFNIYLVLLEMFNYFSISWIQF